MKLVEPTLEQLYDKTEIPKSNWDKTLKKSTFWHLLKDEVEHSINQAKKQDKRDFWIKVKLIAENNYADFVMKEMKRREKNIDDLAKKKQRSL